MPSLPSTLFAFALMPLSLAFFSRYQRHNLAPAMRINKRQQLLLPWTISSEHICEQEESQQQQQCNIHSRHFRCNCPLPGEGPPSTGSCQALLPQADKPEEQLLTIGVAFPLLEQFMDDPERVFLEDLEIFTFIPRESVVIYRRGCSSDKSAYEFHFGILESSCRRAHPQLRTLSPRIFLSNPFFMHENALKVAYIRRAR